MENTMMVVRLHNLLSRCPVLGDALAVAELLRQCGNSDESGGVVTADDVRKRWQTPGFNLSYSAWVIASHKGQIVGYADVRRVDAASTTSAVSFRLTVCVHPDYRERGIETLLIWLAEGRGHDLSFMELPSCRVTISTMVKSQDTDSGEIFQHEGYLRVRRLWRVTIGVEEVSTSSSERGQHTIDLLLDMDDLLEASSQSSSAGVYIVQQYDLYEKVLRTQAVRPVEPARDMQYV
jgi:GNAT superfamily N-acetyltransferase